MRFHNVYDNLHLSFPVCGRIAQVRPRLRVGRLLQQSYLQSHCVSSLYIDQKRVAALIFSRYIDIPMGFDLSKTIDISVGGNQVNTVLCSRIKPPAPKYVECGARDWTFIYSNRDNNKTFLFASGQLNMRASIHTSSILFLFSVPLFVLQTKRIMT